MGERPASGLVAGRVGRPHGLDGSFYVTGPRPRLLRLGVGVTVGHTVTEVVRRDGTQDKPLLRLAAWSTREEVEAVRGSDLVVARQDAPPLGEGEFYAEDVVGCEVVDGDVPVGTVRRMLAYPSCELLEVDRPGRAAALLVPIIDDAVRTLDLEARRVDVDLAFLGEEA